MWDFSRPFPAASKWRRVKPADLQRQEKTAAALRRETTLLQAGAAVPVAMRRRVRETDTGDDIGPDEATALRAFIRRHGDGIAGLLAQVPDESRQLAIARGYRAIVTGQPGAHDAWVRLMRRLSVQDASAGRDGVL
jgi:hypothetical protein